MEKMKVSNHTYASIVWLFDEFYFCINLIRILYIFIYNELLLGYFSYSRDSINQQKVSQIRFQKVPKQQISVASHIQSIKLKNILTRRSSKTIGSCAKKPNQKSYLIPG